MFCSKCGTQNPDDSVFCTVCGASFAGTAPAAAQPVQQPAQYQNQPMPGQPVQQPMPGQPMPYGAQPAYGAPYYGAPAKKSKTVPIVIGIASALVVAFLIVLFTVIIPKSKGGAGVERKVNCVWVDEDNIEYDFPNKKVTAYFGLVSFNFDWSLSGNTLTLNIEDVGSDTYNIEFSNGDRTMTLTNVKDSSDVAVFKRKD